MDLFIARDFPFKMFENNHNQHDAVIKRSRDFPGIIRVYTQSAEILPPPLTRRESEAATHKNSIIAF